MRFVFGPNVMLSAIFAPGRAATLLEAVLTRHRLVVSASIAVECGAVLARPFAFAGGEKERLRRLCLVLEREGCLAVHPRLQLAAVEQDSSGDAFVEAAVWARAAYLVSGDHHILALKSVGSPLLARPVEIVTPAAAPGAFVPRRATG